MSEPARPLSSLPRPVRRNKFFANRNYWKQAIYVTAFLTYLASFLFFGLAVAAVQQSGPTLTSMFDMTVAVYFLIQVIFLFVLSWFVERRRQQIPIDFPNRRESD